MKDILITSCDADSKFSSTYVATSTWRCLQDTSAYSAPVLEQASTNGNQLKILVFFKIIFYSHESIPRGINTILRKMCQQNEFNVDATNIPSYFTTDSLRAYSAVVFPSTTGHVLNYEQQHAFRSYYESGKGFVGIMQLPTQNMVGHVIMNCSEDILPIIQVNHRMQH